MRLFKSLPRAVMCASLLCSPAAFAAGNYSQNFTATPMGWLEARSDWVVTGAYYRNEDAVAPPAIAYYGTTSWTTNFTYKVRAYSEWADTGNQVGLVFGVANDTNYFQVLVNMAGHVTVDQVINSTVVPKYQGDVTPASIGLAQNTWFDLEVFVNGNATSSEVTVRVNDKVVIVKKPITPVPGKIGVVARADMGRFDDVSVFDNIATRLFRGTFRGMANADGVIQPLKIIYAENFPDDPYTCATNAGRWSCWGSIENQDASGDTWPLELWGAKARLQFNAKSLDSHVRNFVDATLVSVRGHVNMQPDGTEGDITDALYFQLKDIDPPVPPDTASHQPQILYNLQPEPSIPQHDLYMRFWTKIPATADAGDWQSLWQMKTASDYRIYFNIQLNGDNCDDDGHLHWFIQGDDVTGSPTGNMPKWNECNMTVAVPIGKWFKVEMFLHRRTGAEDGRFWVAINGLPLFDHFEDDGFFGPGSSQPIDRLLLPQSYGGNSYPHRLLVDDLEVWNGFPGDASTH